MHYHLLYFYFQDWEEARSTQQAITDIEEFLG